MGCLMLLLLELLVQMSQAYASSSHTRRCLRRCSGERPQLEGPLQCKTRHGPRIYSAQVLQQVSEAGVDSLAVQLDADDQGLAEGQFAVFYRQGVCLGSAVISAPPASQAAAHFYQQAAELQEAEQQSQGLFVPQQQRQQRQQEQHQQQEQRQQEQRQQC